MGKTWAEKLTREQRQQVEMELKAFGLDRHQISSLMRFRGRVHQIELELMKKLPSSRWGKRPTISVVKDAIRTCETLGLLKRVGG